MSADGIGLKTFIRVLNIIVEHPYGITKSQIRPLSGITYSHLTTILKRDYLERELITFEHNPKDKRQVLVKPTKKATSLYYSLKDHNI